MTDIRPEIAQQLSNGPKWIRSFHRVKPVLDGMVAAGDLALTAPANGVGRNMVGLTAVGAARYGLAVPDECLVDAPAPKRPKTRVRVERDPLPKLDGRKPAPDVREKQKAQLAEHLAEGGSLNQAVDVLAVSRNTIDRIWKEIQADLGWLGD